MTLIGGQPASPEAQAAKLRGILETAVTAIITISEDGSIESINPATERLFDRRLLSMSLPPSVEVIAHRLVSANESRARLADKAAASASLAQLRGFEPALMAANAPVEDAVRVIRSMLGLPPPETS